MSINPTPEGLSAIFSSKILRDLVGEQIVSTIRDGGVRLGENGLNQLKNMEPSTILNLADQFLGSPAQQEAKPAPAKEEPAPKAPVKEEAPVAEPEPVVEEEVVVEEKVSETPVASPVSEDDVSGALTILNAVFGALTPATRDTAIASVLKLVEASSTTGLTGEHAKWIARLYGNTQV